MASFYAMEFALKAMRKMVTYGPERFSYDSEIVGALSESVNARLQIIQRTLACFSETKFWQVLLVAN